MNTFVIAVIIAGVIAIITLGAVAVVKANSEAATTNKQVGQISCSGCQGKCTAEKNCDLSTCGAVSGGTCGCGKARA